MNYFNYFTEIENTFIRRRGKHLLLSPLDWSLIESWQERNIPLRIVLRGIESVFDSIDRNPNRKPTVKSLTYCRDEIETQYTVWLGTQVGKSISEKSFEVEPITDKLMADTSEAEEPTKVGSESTLFPRDVIENHLSNLEASLAEIQEKSNDKVKNVLRKILEQIAEQKENYKNAETLEDKLNELEGSVDAVLAETKDRKSVERLKENIEKELFKHKATMEKEVYERTFNLMFYKNLREELNIPRFSLFYL